MMREIFLDPGMSKWFEGDLSSLGIWEHVAYRDFEVAYISAPCQARWIRWCIGRLEWAVNLSLLVQDEIVGPCSLGLSLKIRGDFRIGTPGLACLRCPVETTPEKKGRALLT